MTVATIISENFNDGILNGGNWTYSGNDVRETGGHLSIEQRVTDAGGKATYTFSQAVYNATIEMSEFFHADDPIYWHGSDQYYTGSTLFSFLTADNEDVDVRVLMMRNAWPATYLDDPANFDHPRLTILEGGSATHSFAHNITTTSLLDSWLDTKVAFDSDTGDIKVDLNGDSVLEFDTSLASLVGAQLTEIHFDTYGWWTGHFRKIDQLTVTGDTGAPTVGYVAGSIGDAADLWAASGKYVTSATLALAAYHLGESEPLFGQMNLEKPGAEDAFNDVSARLYMLTSVDLAGLRDADNVISAEFVNGLYDDAGSAGLYTNGDSAVLGARADDTLFLSFRGTNDQIDKVNDDADWRAMDTHFSRFSAYLDAIVTYVKDSQSGGAPIDTVFLTGHSLGGAMVMPAYDYFVEELNGIGVSVEGASFASPGYKYGVVEDMSKPIVNYIHNFDVINFAKSFTNIYGESIRFNNTVQSLLLDGTGPVASHSMLYYLRTMEFLQEQGAGIGFEPTPASMADFSVDRINFSAAVNGDDFSIGEGRDIIIAGLGEAVFETAKLYANATAGKIKGLKYIKKFIDLADLLNTTASAVVNSSGDDTVDSAFGSVGASADLLDAAGHTLLAAVIDLGMIAKDALKIGKALSADDVIFGGDQDDILIGLWGEDTIAGGDGNDLLFGNNQIDLLYGGEGDDWLFGGKGRDTLEGGKGNDFYFVETALDQVVENGITDNGIDTIYTQVDISIDESLTSGIENVVLLPALFGSAVNLWGNALDNRLQGNGANNNIWGGGGQDYLFGRGGKDTLRGGDETDLLYGGSKTDKLFGGNGNDLLIGGNGYDEMTGGADADVFVFMRAKEIRKDLITDFFTGRDQIDLSRLAPEADGGALVFTGEGRSKQDGAIWYKHGKLDGEAATIVFVNLNGGWKAEAKFYLLGEYTLLGDDFIL